MNKSGMVSSMIAAHCCAAVTISGYYFCPPPGNLPSHVPLSSYLFYILYHLQLLCAIASAKSSEKESMKDPPKKGE